MTYFILDAIVVAFIMIKSRSFLFRNLKFIKISPRGRLREVGHYRALKKKLSSKEFDALGRVLDELAYNVASTLFATLDGTIKSEIPDFPKVSLVEQGTQTPLAESLQQAFVDVWEE